MNRSIRHAQFALILLSVAAIMAALTFPLRFPGLAYLGLALLVATALSKVIVLLVCRTPYKGRHGAIVDPVESPILWFLGYMLLVAILAFVGWVLLHAYHVA